MIRELYEREWIYFKRDYLKLFIGITIISILLAVMFFSVLVNNPEVTQLVMDQLVVFFEELGVNPGMSHVEMFMIILIQNLRASLLTIAFGIIPVVVLPLVSPLMTSVTVSVVLAFMKLQGESAGQLFLTTIAPHGIIELPALFLSGSVGVFVSITILRSLFTGGKKEVPVMPVLVQAGRTYLLVVAPLIIMAAIVESFVTPVIAYRYMVMP